MSWSRLIVQSRPVPGREEDYHAWYSGVHLQEVLTVPGFHSAQRFGLHSVQRSSSNPEPPFPFLAVYDIDDDPRTVFDALAAARERLTSTDAVAPDALYHVWKPLTPRVTR